MEIGGKTYSKIEWELRCDLAIAYRTCYRKNWHQEIYNHITAKIPGTEKEPKGPHFLINAFGMRFDEITASSLLRINTEGDVLDKGTGTGELLKQGFIVHSAIHMAREDMAAVVHCHHQPTTAVSMLKCGLLPISQEALDVFATISYHPFEGSATDPSERLRMASNLGPSNRILMLENHGVLTGEKTIAAAMWFMFVITRACEYQQLALAAVGGDINKLLIPTEEQVKEMVSRGICGPNDRLERESKLIFEGWRRQCERLDGAENIYC
eukprot:m.146679 g.146679  ORF g.146679 m.146679 type:complete len:268 (-) comp17774_c0_seq4:212-1015(-)